MRPLFRQADQCGIRYKNSHSNLFTNAVIFIGVFGLVFLFSNRVHATGGQEAQFWFVVFILAIFASVVIVALVVSPAIIGIITIGQKVA